MDCCFSFRIGRVAGRLPQELADDVLGSVLDCFRYVCMWKGPGLWLEAVLRFLPVDLLVRAPELFSFFEVNLRNQAIFGMFMLSA